MFNVNCIYNDQNAWCTNKNVKRSLFGLGARVCVSHGCLVNKCKHKVENQRPKPPVKQPSPV